MSFPFVTPPAVPAHPVLTGVSASPVGDYLRDPGGFLRSLVTPIVQWFGTWWPVVLVCLAFTTTVVIIIRRREATRRHARLSTDARMVTVLAPPTVDPSGAITLWSNLVGLLRPGWARRFRGQPHLGFEFVFDADGVRISFWVPGVVPPGMVERAIEAAWPGAHTRTTPARPPIPTSAPTGRRIEAVGGELRLARSEALPIRTDHPADPIRALLGAPVGLGPHERACVQILARPVAGHRVTKARRAARHVHSGGSTRLVGRLLDVITPGKTPKPSSNPRNPGLDRQTSLEFAAQDRVVVDKLRQNQFEVRVRYAVASTVPADATSGEAHAVREVLRGRGHAIASAFAAYAEHNHFRRVRLRSEPVTVLAEHRLGRGDLLSIPELARSRTCRSTRPSPACNGLVRRPFRRHRASPRPVSRSRRSGCPTPATPDRSVCTSPMPATTYTSSVRPARASPS